MKKLFTTVFGVILPCMGSLCIAQLPQGKLWVHTSPILLQPEGRLGYISYPDAVYHPLDSVHVKDMEISGHSLFTLGENLYRYNMSAGQKTDSITGVYGRSLALWKDRLVCTSDSFPYLRVYNSDFSPEFVIDTPLVWEYPMDVMVAGNTAYIAYGDSIQVVDLITRTAIPFGHNFPVSPVVGTYRNLYPANGSMYANFEWFTGAPRVTIVEIDTLVDSLRFVVMDIFASSYFDPVPAGTKVYMGWFRGYYDFSQDTFMTQSQFDDVVVARDSLTESLFVMSGSFSANATISLVNGDSLYAGVSVPGQISKARFYSDFPIALDPDPDFRIHIYPNPSSGLIKFIWPGDQKNPMEITVFSLSGQKLISNLIYDYSGEIDLSGYQSGIYLVVARTENQVITKKIILYR